MRSTRRRIVAIVALSALAAAAAADSVVIPNANETEPAPANQRFPFNEGNMRYQQVYARDQFQGMTGVIQSFAYRVDESTGRAFNSNSIRTQIWFAHTDAGPKNLSNTFDDNMGDDKTLVFDGVLLLSSDGSGAFDIVVDVEDVFSYNGQKNLIVEIKILNSARTTQFDAAGTGLGQGGTDWTDRLWATSPDAQTGSQDGDDGMVTQFTLVGRVCDPCDANCDGSVDLTDIEPFINLLFGEDPCDFCSGDTNDDGSVDLTDIEGFIECLLG